MNRFCFRFCDSFILLVFPKLELFKIAFSIIMSPTLFNTITQEQFMFRTTVGPKHSIIQHRLIEHS